MLIIVPHIGNWLLTRYRLLTEQVAITLQTVFCCWKLVSVGRQSSSKRTVTGSHWSLSGWQSKNMFPVVAEKLSEINRQVVPKQSVPSHSPVTTDFTFSDHDQIKNWHQQITKMSCNLLQPPEKHRLGSNI